MFGSVRFRFLKPETDWTEPNWTGSTSQHLKKITINRIFSNPKVTFTHQPPPSPPFHSLHISLSLTLLSTLIFLSSLYSLWDFCLAVILPRKHGFLRKQRLINNDFFVRDVCLFVFVGSWWMKPRSSLFFSSCFLFCPSLVFGFSLSLVSRFPPFLSLWFCVLFPPLIL